MAIIDITDVTAGAVVNGKWTGTGVFDVLMEAVNSNIDNQYQSGRIKGTDYANVYLGSIQAVLQQSVDYITKKQLIEAQVAEILAGTTRSDTQALDAHNTSLKQQLLLDEEVDTANAQQLLLAENLLHTEAQTAELLAGTTRSDTQALDAHNTSLKQQLLLDEEVDTANAQQLLLAEDLLHREEQLKATYTERVLKDKQAAELGLDNVVKTANVTPEAVYTPKYI